MLNFKKMKLKSTLIFILVLFAVQFSFGQSIEDAFGKRKETYFSFRIRSKEEIHKLTNIISIDNVKGEKVWAYANMKGFLEFSRLGYDITLLPHPGDAPGVEMTDHITLGVLTTWNYYPTYTAYVDLMNQFQSAYPSLCQIQTIATLASGRKILAAKISDNVATDEAEPEFLYTSSIHGDETTGYILMLHLMDYLLTNYGTNTEVTSLVNSMEIYINPLANPDGTYAGGNATVTGATRYNANGVDLNRNYPDPIGGPHSDGEVWQPETVAFMDFATAHHFVASANFHGGAEVVNYPWDTKAELNADDAWWQYVSHEYVDTARIHGNTSYMTDVDVSGITNGYAWYEVKGGRQDYMNYWHHCREVTIELSSTKTLPAASLLTWWNYNYRSLILYMKEARYGIHGIITNAVTGLPLAAKVFVTGHDQFNTETYSSANLGDYTRLIKGGTYTLEVSAPNYQTKTITGVVVADHNTLTLNIQLSPNMVTTAAVSAITQTTAVSGGNVISDGGSAVTARGVCWSTSANPTIAGSHTTDGSGLGSFTSSITGLSGSTVYHIRAYATNSGGTNYGDDLTFSTLCGTISTFPWNEGFENAGIIPNCWTNEPVNNSGISWVFITGNGGSNPAAAHGGTYNACLKDANAADNKTKLVTPTLNLAALSSPVLKFWHTQPVWSGDQDQLIVYYKTSSTGTWTVLATYSASITAWTQETINLPGATGDYYIAFEGNAKYGYGVCIDDVSITGTLKTLSVSPLNQGVTAVAGSTTFIVTSNSAWTASSNQSWCTVTASGTGNGTVSAVYTQNSSGISRVASINILVNGLTPFVVTVTQEGASNKVLNITIFLEGLFDGATMRKAQNASGDQFPGTIADRITVELHNSTAPYAIAGSPYLVDVNTDGSATVTIPSTYSGSYYVAVKHRNSVETWNASPLSFSLATMNYNFTVSAGQAFGNNLKQVSGKYVIYCGDVDQDGVVDSGDITPVDNDALNYLSGYLSTDINSDGIIDTGDMTILDNNAMQYVGKIIP